MCVCVCGEGETNYTGNAAAHRRQAAGGMIINLFCDRLHFAELGCVEGHQRLGLLLSKVELGHCVQVRVIAGVRGEEHAVAYAQGRCVSARASMGRRQPRSKDAAADLPVAPGWRR
jgi:hypothetical protein